MPRGPRGLHSPLPPRGPGDRGLEARESKIPSRSVYCVGSWKGRWPMARKRRMDLAGAAYYVVARGNRQQRLFYTPADYQAYRELLMEAVERFDLRVLAYALLPNQVHLLCRRGSVPLAKVMYHVQRRFAVRHNRRRACGATCSKTVTRQRCAKRKSTCGRWSGTSTTARSRPGCATTPQAYPWSSYREYATRRWDLVHPDEANICCPVLPAVAGLSITERRAAAPHPASVKPNGERARPMARPPAVSAEAGSRPRGPPEARETPKWSPAEGTTQYRRRGCGRNPHCCHSRESRGGGMRGCRPSAKLRERGSSAVTFLSRGGDRSHDLDAWPAAPARETGRASQPASRPCTPRARQLLPCWL